MMTESTYENWLEKHNDAIKKAEELIKEFGFEPKIISEEKKATFIRIFLGNRKIDFMIKVIKTKYARQVWLCKKEAFNPDNIYLIYASKENSWQVVTGKEVDREGEYKESDYRQGEKFVVISSEVFRPAKKFFKLVKERYDDQLQKRMTDYTKPF